MVQILPSTLLISTILFVLSPFGEGLVREMVENVARAPGERVSSSRDLANQANSTAPSPAW